MHNQTKLVHFALFILATLLLLVFISDESEAATYTVDNLGGSDYTNLTQAVENASASDTIRVASRTYYDAVHVDKRLTITGGNYGVDLGDTYSLDCDGTGDLVAHYRFNEGGGSSIDDGNWCESLDGTTDGPSWTTGMWGGALDFDGSNDYVEIDDDDALDFTSAMSVGAWFKSDGITSNQIILSKWYNAGSDDHSYFLYLVNNGVNDKVRLRIDINGSNEQCSTDTTVSSDTWYHVVATYDGSNIRMYLNGNLDNTCSTSGSISTSDSPLIIGNHDGSSGSEFDGIIDDVILWNDALTENQIEDIFWGGDHNLPVVNASNGGYAFEVTAASSQIRYFEIQYSGPDVGDSSGDAGVIIDSANSVKLSELHFKYNRHAIKVLSSDNVEIYAPHIYSCDTALKIGLHARESDNLYLNYGYYQCASQYGIRAIFGTGLVLNELTVNDNKVGILFYGQGNKNNYINNSYITDSSQVGILFTYADNNTVYNTEIKENKYGVSFGRAANYNTLESVDFASNTDFDVHHGYDSDSSVNGWENVLIDTELNDLSIDSDSRLLVKSLIETTIKDNGTFAWNRVNTTLDSDRRAYSGTNSFWAGDPDKHEYMSDLDASFRTDVGVTLPSGGIENSSMLEIRTWYKTETKFDGGRVYITKNDGSNWDLLTPLGGYDDLMQDGTACDNDEKAFTGDKSSTGWHLKKFNLSAYRGEEIKIKFTFCSDSSIEWEGWYIDDVKIYMDSDSSNVLYFDNFERLGHKWVDPREWVHDGSPSSGGKRDVDVVIIEGTSSDVLINTTINEDMTVQMPLDESSGSIYEELYPSWWYTSGVGYNSSGKFDRALDFDGSNDYVYNYQDYISSNPWRYDKITISLWVYLHSLPTGSNYESFISPRYDGDYALSVNSDGNPVFQGYFYNPSGEKRAIGTTEMKPYVWYHLVGTHSEETDTLKIYLNGTLDGSEEIGVNNYIRTSNPNYLGRDYSGRYFDGTLDHVQIWHDDFSASQVRAIYANPLEGPRVYSTEHYGGSDDKTNSTGKLDDVYVITKIYDGSTSGANVDTYIGLRFGDWTREISKITISNNKLEASVLDFRVYNRNKATFYYSIQSAVDAASSTNTIEVWPGKYKENVEFNVRLSIIGSGRSRTIIDARYEGSGFALNSNADFSTIKNLRISHSQNTSSCCNYNSMRSGIVVYYATDVTIDNVHFYESYSGLMSYFAHRLSITNSEFERGALGSFYSGLRVDYGEDIEIKDNVVTGYSYGIYLSYTQSGLEVHGNHIHNNTNYGIYTTALQYGSLSDPYEFQNNILADNNYGIYTSGCCNNNYNRYFLIEGNIFRSSSNYQIYAYYMSQDWIIENNTFDGDSDSTYGIYAQRPYRAIIGNNTFSDHTTRDLYFQYCTGTNFIKSFFNTFSTVQTSSCILNIYNNLNIKTVEEDEDAFSEVEIEVKDSSKTYYETPHWGGSDSTTDSSGFISNTMLIRSGYYSSSTSLTENNITINVAFGVRAKSTWVKFDEDTTKIVTIPDTFRFGVVENTNTSTLYTSFTSAISSASTNHVLDVWAWTYNENVIVNKAITLVGNSTSSSVIDGGTGDYAIEVKSNGVTIKNLTLNGATDSLLYAGNYAGLTVENVVMSSLSSNHGIYFDRTRDSTISSVTVNNTDRKSVYVVDGDTITFKDSFFMNASSSHGFEITSSEEITLDNVFIYNSGYNGSSSYGLYISSSDKITVQNSTKVGASKTFEFYASEASNLLVKNSSFIGDNLALVENSNSFLIENSVFKGTSSGDYGVHIKNTNNAIFKFNTIKDSASDDGSDYGSIYLTSSSSNSILNNTVTNSGRSGIHLKSSSNDNKVYGNTVTGSNYPGLYVQSSDGALVRNNTFSSSTDHGIKVSSSDTVEIDNNTLSSNDEYGLYVSSSDEITIKSNTASDNNAGIYVTGSDDSILSLNTVDDHASYGVYLSDSKRLKIKKNIIKNSLSDALVLSSNCDNSFVDNNTIKNNGDSTSGRSVRLYEVDNSVLYNNTIESNDYTGLVITASSDNDIIQNVIKSNGKYGIQISNDIIKSANNTIKGNTINDNAEHGIHNSGIYTKIISNTIKFNLKDGIYILNAGARSTVQENTITDNEDSAIQNTANHITITLNTIDGDSSTAAIIANTARSVIISNNTIEGGSQGVKVQNSTNSFIYNNTVSSNSDYGIYLLLGSHNSDIKSNKIRENEDIGLFIQSSNSADVKFNTINDNDGYGISVQSSTLAEFRNNTIKENDGGIKFNSCHYCNLTSVTIVDNGGRGLWFVDSNDNYIRHVNSSGSSDKDIYLQGSIDNTAFNFTFSTIFVNSTAELTITSNLEIIFQDSDGDGFPGIDFALLTKGVKVYSTPFYGGSDAVSDSNGEAGATFSLDYRIYNGSSTPTNIANVLKYHYGVRSKEKSIDMSTSHTETVSVPSFWVKGLVRNTDTATDYYKIQDAIDNASSGDVLHIWAWTYNENVDLDASVTIIGNGTGNTTLNATSSGVGFNVTSDDVSISNILVTGCGSTFSYNAFRIVGDDVTIEDVIGTECYVGIAISASNFWMGNSSFTNNHDDGVQVGANSNTVVKFYNNNVSSNGGYGFYINEDDVIIKSNTINDNFEDGIRVHHAEDVVIDKNTISENNGNGIRTTSESPRIVIKNNVISDSNTNGIRVSSSQSDRGIIESNSISGSGEKGILIEYSDYYYLGNNTISSSNSYDIQFNHASIGNSAKNTTFSTIYIHANAYFAIYNDLTLKFMQNATTGFEDLDVKLVSDGSTKYSTSFYGGSDSKTDSDGLISSNFTLKFRIYDGSSTPDEATTTLYYHYGVRSKSYDINMTTSHTETVTVPTFWKQGLIKNLNSGHQSATIQDAIDNASSGDVLQLWDWDYIETNINVTERVTIVGNSSGVTISGGWQDTIFTLKTNTITIKNLTITRSGNGTTDSCLYANLGSGITIENVTFDGCNIGIRAYTAVLISEVTVKNSVGHGIIAADDGVRIENSTINNNGGDGIVLSSESIVYNNTITSNTGVGVSTTLAASYSKIIDNHIDNNDEQGILLASSHHVEVRNNLIEDNENYGIQLYYANYTQINSNTVEENDGGLRAIGSVGCNITSSIFKDNNGKGIWFTVNSDSNNIRDSSASGSSSNDIELDSSKKNTGFNFTFGSGSIDVDSDSDFRIMNTLNIKFVNGSSAFEGVELELFNYDTVLYASVFYGGNDGSSGSDGFIDKELTVAYEIYNGSSTTEDVQTFLKYNYGVRGKTIEIDMSTSHTETVDVPSYWTKGLVRNKDTSTDYYRIQDAIDNASAGDTLHVWAWTYYEALEIDESISIIGNASLTTKIVAGSDQYNSDLDSIIEITSDDVTLRNLTIIQNTTNFTYGIKSVNNDITISNSIIDYWIASASGKTALYAEGDNFVISNNSIYEAEYCIELSNSDGALVENNILGRDSSTSDSSKCFFQLYQSDNNIIKNNTFTDSSYGFSLSSSSSNLVSDNKIIKDLVYEKSGIRLSGTSTNNQIINNTVSGYESGIESRADSNYFSANVIDDNHYGIFLTDESEYNKFENNTIKNSEYYGILIQDTLKFNEFWNNTISSSDAYDFYVDNSTGNFIVNTQFTTISIDSSSDLLVREYFVLDVNDASGSNMGGIDLKVMEDDVQKYATDYFGGSDPKTDSSGTIATFLINHKIYNGSSTPTTIPTYVSARSNDWVETSTSDPSTTIQITVPDLRVQNTRTGTLTYHIQTALDNAIEGDTIRAWNGTYNENIEVTEELTIIGNGTSTIIHGSNGTAFEILEDSVTIQNLLIVYSEKGIYVNAIDDTVVSNVKFIQNEYAIYSEDSNNLIVNNTIFDVDDYGVYLSGSTGVTIIDNEFRNGTETGDYCLYQAESSDNGEAIIRGNKFNDCNVAWRSGSSSNIFSDNTLKDNEYGVLLSGTEANNNLLSGNSFDDSGIAIYIYNTAYDNNLYDNFIDDSDDYDIKLSDSYDTVSYNNTFSSISVESDANMWIKVYIDVDVTDNSSNGLSNVDLEILQDSLSVYSTIFYGGSDSRTNITGQIEEFLVAISQFNGSSTSTPVTTTVNARYSDWVSSETYNINNAVEITVDDFRVKNDDTDQMFYSINGAIAAASDGDTLLIWSGTYYENVILDKELTLTGNGTSSTIINGSYSGNVITISVDEVLIEHITITGSGSNDSGILTSEGDSVFTNLRFVDNYKSFTVTGDFNELSYSVILDSSFGAVIEGDNNIVSHNVFSDTGISIKFTSTSEDGRANNNEITDGTNIAIQLAGSEETTIRDNYIHNNSAFGVVISNGSSDNEIYTNDFEYNSEYSVSIVDSGNNSIHNNTFKSNDDGAASFDSAYYNVFRDNTLNANDDYTLIDGGGQNSILHNTFTEDAILIQNSNNQIISFNSITDAPNNGIKIFKSSSNNYLSNNIISGSDDEDLYVGGSGSQINNRGYNNTFSSIKVQGNGEFVVLDHIGLRTINSDGNMSGNDVRATFGEATLYASPYFGGTDPVTDSNGLIPYFVAPIEIYDGSSTPTKVITPMTVRSSDWIETFNLDPYSGSSITVFVPELRVKNDNTGEWSYLVQTAIDNAGVNDILILSNSTYYENIVVNKAGVTIRGPLENQNNPGVVIDAENDGCAVTVTKSGVSILGLTIVNSYEFESPFNSSGIRVLSNNNEILYNTITDSYVGILLEDATYNKIKNNSINDVDTGILLTKSGENSISYNLIDSVDNHDILLTNIGYSEGSKHNTISENIDIDSMKIVNSPSNLITNSVITTLTLENSDRISSILADFDYVVCDSSSSLYLKNYMNLNVSRLNTPLSGVDIRVTDGETSVYSTNHFGGDDQKTDSEGRVSDILVIYRVYEGSSTGVDNNTIIKVRVGDWYKSSSSVVDEYTIFDFNVPHFRVTNVETATKYAYIQTAIDNATAGNTIQLEPGTYRENIVIDKELVLTGKVDLVNSTIITVDASGLGAPPLANISSAAITIFSDDVEVYDLIISNFSKGIEVYEAVSVSISRVTIFDAQGHGIMITDSDDVLLSNVDVSYSGSHNILISEGSDDITIEHSVIEYAGTNGLDIRGSNVLLNGVHISDNTIDGIRAYATASGIEIRDCDIVDNGGNGIEIAGTNSGQIHQTTIMDSGGTEVRLISVSNLEFYQNTVLDSQYGYGVHLTDGDSNILHDNTMFVGIWLDKSHETSIYENEFRNITGGSSGYDDSAIIISSSNNTISDNIIDNVGIAFAFFPANSPNHNLIENNTVEISSLQKSIEYYTSGRNNTFINTDISYVDISEDSYFEVLHYIDIEMTTVLGPAEDVELEITEGDSIIYATSRYDGSDSMTDSLGKLERLFIVSEIYDGDYVADYVSTSMRYYYDNVEYVVDIDTDSSHQETIWTNLRPISGIGSIEGIGDLTLTGTEEAVKGADIELLDQNTIAYWPFDEGTENQVSDDMGNHQGVINFGKWEEEPRTNSSDPYSIEFDGSITNVATDLTLNDYEEFTIEVWFNTDTVQTGTLVSDKDSQTEWGYNLYIDGFPGELKFDFTSDGGNVVSVKTTESVTDGNWHFVAVVRGPDYVELWLDGELAEVAFFEGEVDYSSSEMRIGQTAGGIVSFGGLIDDIRVSNIARHNEDFMIGKGIVTFSSLSYDVDGEITDYIWESSWDGEIGRGPVLYYPVHDLTEGSHSIQLSVVDNNGTISDYATKPLVVMQRPDSEIVHVRVNDVPQAWGWGIEVNSGDQISLKGQTTSGQVIPNYSWTSSIDGLIHSDGEDGISEFLTETLSNGTHQISFRLQGVNTLWSPTQTFEITVNGRPVIGHTVDVSDEFVDRLKSASFRVPIEDDNSAGSQLTYEVSYRVKGTTESWETDYITNVNYDSTTGELEFDFEPDAEADTGEYEFFIGVTDELGGTSDYYVMNKGITVQNNVPEIKETGVDADGDGLIDESPVFQQGDEIELTLETEDSDGDVSNVTWFVDLDNDGEIDEDEIIAFGSSPAQDQINYEVMEVGENEITVVITDDDGDISQDTFIIEITAAPVENSAVEVAQEFIGSNLPLIAGLSVGLVMVLGTIALRRNRGPMTEVDSIIDDVVSDVQVREEQVIEDWEIPTDAQGNALIIGEYMAKRREAYLTHPNNEEVLDYLHNNRERFTISSYFDVPADPTVVITDWALPENLRGNVHLDSFRQQLVERITNSKPDKNFVIIGEPGVGKTVMLFEVFDRLMYKSPVGILSTDTIAKAHEMFGVRVFYDDIPENQKLVEALTDNEISGVIVTSREADWKALPTEMQAKFDRLTVPLFSELDMKKMIEKMMTFQSIGFNDEAVDVLAEYAEGSPIYVWSMVREMMHRSVKSLSADYIKENSVKGMINYVAQLLQRLLKDGEEYRDGGLHALASLIFLSDHMEERYCNDYFFDAYVEELSKHTEDKLGDKMNPKTLNLVLAYLPINDSVIRFPHDTWPDVLQGWGDMNPFSTELRMINRAFADSGVFQDLKKEVVGDVWKSTYERYKRTPSRQKNSLLALADTLFQNFTIDELEKLNVDIDIVRQVASTYSHIPQAAKLLSKIQAVLPQTVTRIINMQDIDSERGHVPYKIQEMYLIYNDGRMISSLMDEEAKVDSDIMSSMLTAINDFVKDSFQTSGNLGSIDYGENQIILERGKHTILASVVYGEANRDLRSRMGRALTKIEDAHGSKLRSWDGDVDSLSECVDYLQPIMDLSKSVTKDMIDELQALRDVSLKSSWSQIAGFVQVNLMINNYSKKQLKGAKLTLEYGADYLKLVKTEPEFKHTVTEVDIKKIGANDELAVALYFEPLKSTQASLNVHLDYDSKGGQSSGVSTAVFERVNMYKEGVSLNLADLDNATKAEIVADEGKPVTAEVVEAEVVSSDVEVMDTVVEDAEPFETETEVVEESKLEEEVPEEPQHDVPDPGESGVDDIMSKLNELDGPSDDVSEDVGNDSDANSDDDLMSKLSELDDPENQPKKKADKSEEEEDKSGMDDILGKLDEL